MMHMCTRVKNRVNISISIRFFGKKLKKNIFCVSVKDMVKRHYTYLTCSKTISLLQGTHWISLLRGASSIQSPWLGHSLFSTMGTTSTRYLSALKVDKKLAASFSLCSLVGSVSLTVCLATKVVLMGRSVFEFVFFLSLSMIKKQRYILAISDS